MPQQDEFQSLAKDIKLHATRLSKAPPKSLEALNTEIHGTLLSFTGDTVQLMINLRAWMFEEMNTLSSRIEEIAEPTETVILPEDAEKLQALFFGVKELIKRSLEVAATDDVRAVLTELAELNQECETIVADSVLEEDGEGDEGDEEDEPEEDEPSAGATV